MYKSTTQRRGRRWRERGGGGGGGGVSLRLAHAHTLRKNDRRNYRRVYQIPRSLFDTDILDDTSVFFSTYNARGLLAESARQKRQTRINNGDGSSDRREDSASDLLDVSQHLCLNLTMRKAMRQRRGGASDLEMGNYYPNDVPPSLFVFSVQEIVPTSLSNGIKNAFRRRHVVEIVDALREELQKRLETKMEQYWINDSGGSQFAVELVQQHVLHGTCLIVFRSFSVDKEGEDVASTTTEQELDRACHTYTLDLTRLGTGDHCALFLTLAAGERDLITFVAAHLPRHLDDVASKKVFAKIVSSIRDRVDAQLKNHAIFVLGNVPSPRESAHRSLDVTEDKDVLPATTNDGVVPVGDFPLRVIGVYDRERLDVEEVTSTYISTLVAMTPGVNDDKTRIQQSSLQGVVHVQRRRRRRGDSSQMMLITEA